MWRFLYLLPLCCAVKALDSPDPTGMELSDTGAALRKRGSEPTLTGRIDAVEGERRVPHPATEPLEDELDNQENIISQLLGDYDKVKTVSSGSDCECRCVVRPIKRSDCSRIHDADIGSLSQDFYSVETIAKGSDCKKCVCMAPPSAVNPCEGEYRFKRLQEASKDDIKLATIMDMLEGSLYGMDLIKLNSVTTKLLARVDNMEKVFTQSLTERSKEKDRVKEKTKDKKIQQKKKKIVELEHSVAKSGTSAKNQKNFDDQIKKKQKQDDLEQQQPNRNETETKNWVKNNVFIKGVTFYKADEESDKGEDNEKKGRGKNISPNLNEDSLIPTESGQKHPSDAPTRLPRATTASSKQTTTTTVAAKSIPSLTTTKPMTDISPPNETARTRSRLSWTESPADQPKVTKKPGVCKDTVASISEPVQQNSYGLRDGAWMKDARGHGNVIYLTIGQHGNTLLEFRDMETFKEGQTSNSYKLPYSFTGTGHVVFNGAFYYNRAFSRDVIRYDLRHRYVSAWTTLHDAVLEEQAHRTQTEVQFAVDESGLWMLYPALDMERFHQEVLLLIHLHPRDLQPIRTFRTGLRRGHYGNAFLVCGVLYGVDSMERRYANVTYAFDTHTLTHTVPSLAFTNTHGHMSQLSYCPLDKKLYAWDGGHQMTYDVIFAY